MGAGRGRRGLAWDLIPEQPEAPIYSTVAYFSLLNGQTYLSAPRRPEWGPQQLGAFFWGTRVLLSTGQSFYPEQKDALKNNRFSQAGKKNPT